MEKSKGPTPNGKNHEKINHSLICGGIFKISVKYQLMVAGVAGVFRAPAGIAVRLARSRELVQVHHRLVAASLALDPLPCRPPAITVAVIVSFIPSISFLFSQELSHPFHLSFID